MFTPGGPQINDRGVRIQMVDASSIFKGLDSLECLFAVQTKDSRSNGQARRKCFIVLRKTMLLCDSVVRVINLSLFRYGDMSELC